VRLASSPLLPDRRIRAGGAVVGEHVAHTGPEQTHTLEKLHYGGEVHDVVAPAGAPIRAVLFKGGGKFFLARKRPRARREWCG